MSSPFASRASRKSARLSEPAHFVQFYNADRFLVEQIARRAQAALVGADSCVLIATQSHLNDTAGILLHRGVDIENLRKTGRYIELDAACTLNECMHGNRPDEIKFQSLLGDVIRRAAASSRTEHVSAFGEMVALLCASGNSAAAVQLEKLWNALGESLDFSLCCAYPLAAFADDFDGSTLLEVCEQHALALPAEALV